MVTRWAASNIWQHVFFRTFNCDYPSGCVMMMNNCLMIGVHAASYIMMCALASCTLTIIEAVLTFTDNARTDRTAVPSMTCARITSAFNIFGDIVRRIIT